MAETPETPAPPLAVAAPTRLSAAIVTTGADAIVGSGFSVLAGKRVGLITNHTGRVGTERLIDVLAGAPGVTLAAILTPEHGLSGAAEAGAAASHSGR